MNDGLKQRLIGALVLVGIAVIFLPGFFKEQQLHQVDTRTQVPPRPDVDPVVIDAPRPVTDEPAPDPDTLFMPDSEQPVAEDLEQLQAQTQSRSAASSVSSRSAASAAPAQASPGADAAGGEEGGAASEPDQSSASSTAGSDAAPEAWVVQVASLRSAESAQRLRKKLQERGYKAYVRLAKTSQGEVSRVFIGPKVDRALAQAVKDEIDPVFKVDSLVLKFKP